MTFSQLLTKAVLAKGTPVLVGLDPKFDLLPESMRAGVDHSDLGRVSAVLQRFCCEVIDVVALLVPAVKLQAACFERYGSYGMVALDNIIKYATEKGLITIFDGKRGDIGSTAELYATGILGKNSAWGADAMTVSPYMGSDSIEPFVKTATKQNAGIFVLVKTSNQGSTLFQNLTSDQKTIYQHVAHYVQKLAAQTTNPDPTQHEQYGAVGAVVGATWSKDIAALREILKSAWLLVPGFGNQGATAEDVAPAFDQNGLGAIINNSRGLLYAYKNEPHKSKYGEQKWELALENATKNMIEQLKTKTTAGKLYRSRYGQ
ncbi:MAG: orotidine-5'-phosphate decarboxylase [Planctomycetaceae bacterium]|jgi:orotidine-5'-phosphate decarboxylase|nr:orotidine-5'-phosphate decarboxylase [Planctomycetaceae bacterium]